MPAVAMSAAQAPPLEDLAGLRPTELPAPPDVALRVMHACSDPDSDARGIAGLVGADATLTAELLRIVNSAYFGFAGEVTSVAQAVSILGQRSLRHYVLCIAVRDALGDDVMHGRDVSGFWRTSLARAVAARALAGECGAGADECFTVGLLLDIGLAALFHTRPDLLGHWDALLRADPDTRRARERELFGVTHDHAGAALASAWGLPDRLGAAIGAHHAAREPGGAGSDTLARIAHAADWAGAVYRADVGRADVARACEVICAETDLERPRVEALLRALPDEVASAATAFGFDLMPGPELDELLRDANLALVESNVSMQELNWRLERALTERDAVDARLRGEVETARLVQRSLIPRCDSPQDGADLPFSGLNAPALELSGDFYDHFQLADGRSFFCLADVSGKGMDAALLMAKTSGLFHCLGKLIHDPAKLLGLVNAELVETSVRGMFVTMVAGIYDPEKRAVTLVNAGHPPALLVDSRGDVSVLSVQAPPLGIVAGQTYRGDHHEIGGRSMYLFSDGLIEAPDGAGGRLGYSGLVEVVRSLGEIPRAERPARLLSRVARTHDLAADDVTVLVLEA